MVTLMLPQRHVPVIEPLKLETSYWFGSPVNAGWWVVFAMAA